MDLGIQLGASAAGGVSSHDAIDHSMWAARYADEAGFDYIWTTEHHFTENVHTGAPSAILAYFAGVTERAKLGYGVAIVPLHHPLRLAEELAWVDNLSKGRLVVGISPGWAAYEFELFGVPHEERRERLDEAFDIIKLALSNETFSYHGRFWQIDDLRVFPPPRQRNIPFAMSCNQNESVERAADWKIAPLLGFPPAPILRQQRDVWENRARANGTSETEINDIMKLTGVRKFIIIGKTDKEAEDVALQATARLQGTMQRLLTTSDGGPQESTVRTASGEMVTLDHTDVRNSPIFGNHLYGTPDTIVEKLLELEKVGGMSHCICVFGGAENGLGASRESIKLFSKEILPVIQKSKSAVAAV